MPNNLDPTLGRQQSDIIRARYLNTILLEADLATYNIKGERKGELVYCEDSAEIKCWNGTAWVDVGGGGAGHEIRENGTAQTTLAGLDFIDAAAGAGLVTDGATANKVNLDLYILKALLTTRGDTIRRGASAPERVAMPLTGQYMGANGTDTLPVTPVTQGELADLAQGANKTRYYFPVATGLIYTKLYIAFRASPTVKHSFTFRKNATTVIGAVSVIAAAAGPWTTTVSAFSMAANDYLEIRHDTSGEDADEDASHTSEGTQIFWAIY